MNSDPKTPDLGQEDPETIRVMAHAAAGAGRHGEAETLLRRGLALAPDDVALRFDLASTLHKLDRPAEAVDLLRPIAQSEPDHLNLHFLLAVLLERTGRYEEALAVCEGLLRQNPQDPLVLVTLASLLTTAGRTEESVRAYRDAIALKPRFGEAWWGLANLKTDQLGESDVVALKAAVEHPYLTQDDAVKLHFALAKALEDAGDAEAAFDHYRQANELRLEDLSYDPAEITRFVDRAEALLTPAFFSARADHGADAPDPVFIVGLPRAGSTLVDQILSSHPEVEGTAELPDLLAIARRLRTEAEAEGGSYPDLLADLSAADCRALGEEYLARTRVRRRSDRRFFIDKTPNNWAHIGLIELILPEARIVDVRRHPLGCCLSNYKQHFAEGQEFSYSLDHLGRYYGDYVRLLRHFDQVLPGRVHRVVYEALVEDMEAEVRRLLHYLGLEFDPAVLRFHETERAVHTPSAEQVRRPINRRGMDNWQPFERFLDPLKASLGTVLEAYPAAP